MAAPMTVDLFEVVKQFLEAENVLNSIIDDYFMIFRSNLR